MCRNLLQALVDGVQFIFLFENSLLSAEQFEIAF